MKEKETWINVTDVEFAVSARRWLHDKISAITERKGRRRPGFGCRVEAVRVLDGGYTVYRNIPEWCSYSGRLGALNDYKKDRPLYSVSPLSCDRIMKDSAIGAFKDAPSVGCRYTDCVNRGCANCRGAYKGVGAFMELRGRLREAGGFYSGKRPADDLPAWPLLVETFLPGGWRISKNLTAGISKNLTADD